MGAVSGAPRHAPEPLVRACGDSEVTSAPLPGDGPLRRSLAAFPSETALNDLCRLVGVTDRLERKVHANSERRGFGLRCGVAAKYDIPVAAPTLRSANGDPLGHPFFEDDPQALFADHVVERMSKSAA
jgi:hypothetical protein